MNKKTRRGYRKSPKATAERANELESSDPEVANSLRGIASVFSRVGLPAHSKKKRSSHQRRFRTLPTPPDLWARPGGTIKRKERADFRSFDKIMKRKGGAPPREGDEMPTAPKGLRSDKR